VDSAVTSTVQNQNLHEDEKPQHWNRTKIIVHFKNSNGVKEGGKVKTKEYQIKSHLVGLDQEAESDIFRRCQIGPGSRSFL